MQQNSSVSRRNVEGQKRVDKLYKIRNKKTGLYSVGGVDGRFSKVGKVWKMGPVKLHLMLIQNRPCGLPGLERYKDCEVVEYEMHESRVLSISDVLEKRN